MHHFPNHLMRHGKMFDVVYVTSWTPWSSWALAPNLLSEERSRKCCKSVCPGASKELRNSSMAGEIIGLHLVICSFEIDAESYLGGYPVSSGDEESRKTFQSNRSLGISVLIFESIQ